jgi:myo-inositol 2-dehydrogenase / D-chiro-inositol 1-dehydrogenase
MANSIHRVAQLGAGRMGQAHLGNAAANPRLHLAAVVDPRPDIADVAAHFGSSPSTFEAVLDDKSIGGVIVATSTDLHLDQTLACLKAGKAVFCEKPLDLALERLVAEEAALRAADDRLFVAFNRRFDPGIAKLRADLRAGVIGDLESLHIVNHDPAAPPGRD